ncbi:hypothetical protein P152DRAFT_476664 [Eremomyces bilateralis CBS 781.70]|uniref:lytic cellulose monooxygenase (C4-dehydrogenating) n=1 Tax=Eremomyces bilateralis CBS 781.70 TaxID=1392243 RepID=A0A6G1FTT6_9PEZI|nr:uncharacterized protein P152DRAFT_476664 [Eremomyces bilateralis CBS 781.70]KAF1809089.1 hypothetical protein P152DRAFT_476664 [Eremomyces bilateralis CBS 781.70]
MRLSLLLFVGAVCAHTTIKNIVIDGNAYHPFDERIDHLVGPVKRIGWTYDVVPPTFNPVTDFSSPDIACRKNAIAPALKAIARAGAEVILLWTPITRMHWGPGVAYLGRLPTPETSPNDIKFFKIYEKGFDATADKWANQLANDEGDMYKLRLPSDIAPGTYILRAELIALHGNMKELMSHDLKEQIQIYPYCFSIEITGSGTANPEGVTFPGPYKGTDPSFTFAPAATYLNSTEGFTEENSKFVPPGPPLYDGKYAAPTGPRPTVTREQTGAYPPELEVIYQDLIRKIERPALKLATYINTAWPGYQADSDTMKTYAQIGAGVFKESNEAIEAVKGDILAFKNATQGYKS